MKNLRSTIFFCAFALMTSQLTFSQEFKKLDKSPMDVAAFPTSYKISDKIVKVTYSRPQLKGRALTKLAPTGEVWRTGANEAPELILYKSFNLNGTDLKAGSYALLTIPGEKEWTIILHSDLNTWGSYFYKKENDVVRISVPVTASSDSLEAFSIAFEDNGNNIIMHMGWDMARVAIPFKKIE